MIISKDRLINSIKSDLSDNSTGNITPYDIRHNLLDIIDSAHLLTADNNITAANFGTPNNRTTHAGVQSLEKLKLDGYSSTDNTAIGYQSQRSSYQTSRNSSIGAFSLSCNVYGGDNVAIGYNSLAGNTTGHGNIGVGSLTSKGNTLGHGNISLGHGAGYYAPKNSSFKLYIGNHILSDPTKLVDDSYACDNPSGSGVVPLIYGDVQSLRVGIATKDLHQYAALQTSGNIAPTVDNVFDLGALPYRWKTVYLDKLQFDPTRIISKGATGLEVSSDLLPTVNESYDLGSSTQRWDKGYFDDIFANFASFYQRSYFSHKTIYLASSGEFVLDGGGPTGPFHHFPCPDGPDPSPTLEQKDVYGAGFLLDTKDGNRYSFTLVSGVGACSTSTKWESNVSLTIPGDNQVESKSFVTPASNLCYGFHADADSAYLSPISTFRSNATIAGIGNINVFTPVSGETFDFTLNSEYGGTNISQRFLSRTANKTQTDGQDNLTGFGLTFYDASNSDRGWTTNVDRFVISSYDNLPSTSGQNHMTLMKNNEVGGVFGINNFDKLGAELMPETIFNVRSRTHASARITAETTGYTNTSLELLGGANCLRDGAQFIYRQTSGVLDINMYSNEVETNIVRSDGSKLGFLSSGVVNDAFTFGGAAVSGALAIQETSTNPSKTDGYGKLWVAPKISTGQTQTLYLLDDGGNIHDFVLNKNIGSDGLIFTDSRGNTLGGNDCTADRTVLDSNGANWNTAFGEAALSGVTAGDGNTMYGYRAGNFISTGSYNVGVGYQALHRDITTPSNYNIAIGCHSIGEAHSGDYAFMLGATNDNLLMKGVLGPNANDKRLELPNGKLEVSQGNDHLALRFNSIELYDGDGSDLPASDLKFNFRGNEAATLLNLNHGAVAMSNSAVYQSPSEQRPYAELKGDLKLQGDIRFSDSTSLASAAFLSTVNKNKSDLQNIFVEGKAVDDIITPSSLGDKQTGYIMTLDGNQTFSITNLDPNSIIKKDDFVIAIKINGEFRPIWITNENSTCKCCAS
tara:strand:- start:10920 stop:13994 length:3075 start_codon:yes stop_codon:yes gene_type:complete